MSGVLLMLLVVGSTYAATHVNISIAQQRQQPFNSLTNPADVSYVDGHAPAELRAGPEERFGRLQAQPMQQQQQQQQHQPQQQQSMPAQQQQQQQSQSASQDSQLTPRQNLGLQPPHQGRMPRPQMRRGHMRRPSMQQQQQQQQQQPMQHQFRQRSQQLQQNQEFERYIQSYHSQGPTVETVYETSSPSSASASSSSSSSQRHTQSSSSSSSAPQRQVNIGGRSSPMMQQQFERQVALPAASAASSNSGSERSAAHVEQPQHQDSKPIYESATIAPAAAATQSSSSSAASSSAPSSSDGSKSSTASFGGNAGYDPAASYDAANSYAKPSYDAGSQYQPSYDPNGYNYDDGQDYQDQYPPSVEADNLSGGYEDYADQSYYSGGGGGGAPYLPPPQRGYASPSRPSVVTKTIQIVQPALKAKKYEVRHPAIQKEFYDIEERVIIKPAGTLVVELDRPVAKIPKGETLLPLGHPHPAVASAYSNNKGQINDITQSYNNNEYRPSYEAAKEGQQSTTVGSSVTTMPSYEQAPRDEFVEQQLQQQPKQQSSDEASVYIGNNEQQINTKNLSPKMLTESNYNYPSSSGAAVEQPQSRGYPRSFNRPPVYSDDDYFRGEYLPNANSGNVDTKPARLEEQPQRMMPAQIIRHEHNINLPPSQHNIYLSRQREQAPAPREQPAQVSELKPYLRNYAGGTVVYAKAPVRQAANTRGYYPQSSFAPSSSRLRSPLAEDLEYSAPYSRMRFNPEQSSQSSRLMEAPHKHMQEQSQAHIQIQIPNHDDSNKSIMVSSTISPGMDKLDCEKELPQQQHFQRLVETPTTQATPTQAAPTSAASSASSVAQRQPEVDVSLKSAAGHLSPNERVIAATPAPSDASGHRETFHKRRIVVNHPFQTVREVVEHEPITNYHQIKVNEHASPALYHQAAYYQPPAQTHGQLIHYNSVATHGNLYAQPLAHMHAYG